MRHSCMSPFRSIYCGRAIFQAYDLIYSSNQRRCKSYYCSYIWETNLWQRLINLLIRLPKLFDFPRPCICEWWRQDSHPGVCFQSLFLFSPCCVGRSHWVALPGELFCPFPLSPSSCLKQVYH